jgi:hypothetical protein
VTDEAVLAALGTIRQDVRSLIAAVARLEGIVRPEPPEEPWCNIEGCNCHPKPPADLS